MAKIDTKALIEKRNEKAAAMEEIANKAVSEVRALTEEEQTQYGTLKSEIEALDRTIELAEENRDLMEVKKKPDKKDEKKEEGEDEEVRAFEDYLRSGDTRAVTKGNSGAIVPVKIANRIIDTVKELCPILELADSYYTAGKLVFPVYGAYTDTNGTHDIVADYVAEGTAPTEDSGKFTSVELTGYIVGVTTKVSKSLINNTEFDLLSYVVNKVAEAIAEFLEKELLNGTTDYATGALSTNNTVVAEDDTAFTADELLALQMAVISRYQKKAVWIMHPSTWLAVRQLKDANGQYLIGGYGGLDKGADRMLLGKPVYVSESMPEVEASAKAVLYGDMKGLAVKFSDRLDLELLREKYAENYQVGVTAHCEFDCNVVDHQRIACLTMAAS